MEVTAYTTHDGVPVLPPPKTAVRIRLSAFRPARQFTERFVSATLQAANGSNAGAGAHLDALLRSWVEADCTLERWARANPREFVGLRDTCDQWRVIPFEGLVPEPGRYHPVLEGAVGLDVEAEPREHAEERVAYDRFAAFVLLCGGIRIALCDRCKNLYWNRWGHTNKRFCGRKCSQLQTAAEGQANKVAKRRREKNRKIREALRAFIEDKPATPDWKAWVAQRARVTRSYLTRTFNRGLLGEPDGLKLTKSQVSCLESKGESHGNL